MFLSHGQLAFELVEVPHELERHLRWLVTARRVFVRKAHDARRAFVSRMAARNLVGTEEQRLFPDKARQRGRFV